MIDDVKNLSDAQLDASIRSQLDNITVASLMSSSARELLAQVESSGGDRMLHVLRHATWMRDILDARGDEAAKKHLARMRMFMKSLQLLIEEANRRERAKRAKRNLDLGSGICLHFDEKGDLVIQLDPIAILNHQVSVSAPGLAMLVRFIAEHIALDELLAKG